MSCGNMNCENKANNLTIVEEPWNGIEISDCL